MRRFGEPVIAGQIYATRPGAYAMIREGRDLLVTEQISQGEFQLPGGGLDPGESPLRALVRECYEETGWTLHSPRRLGAFQRYCYMPEYDRWAHKVCHIYLCHPGLRRGPPPEPDHRAVWMPISTACDQLAVEGDRWFVRSLGRGA